MKQGIIKRIMSLLMALAMIVACTASFHQSAAADEAEVPDILDPKRIEELKNQYFLPAAEEGTLLNGGTPRGATVLKVDKGTKYQVIEGFGASGCWVGPSSDKYDEEAFNKALLLLYSKECGIGLIGYRHNVGGGNTKPFSTRATETVCIEVAPGVYDTSVDAVNMSVLKKIQKLGVPSIGLIYYSPPARMTKSGNTAGNPNPGTNLKEEYFDDFAEYVIGTAKAIEAEGIDIKYISPFNEPAWGGSGFVHDGDGVAQEGCYYTPGEVYDLTERIAKIMEREQVNFGLGVAESPWWSLTDYTSNLFARYLKSDVIMSHLDHFCAHSYTCSAEEKARVAPIFLQHPEVNLHQTEENRQNKAFMNSQMIETIDQSRLLYEDLTILNISEWDYWVMMDTPKEKPSGGLINLPVNSTELQTPKRFYMTGQYSKFITGATRIGCDLAGDEAFYATAYLDPNNETITLVICNYNSDPRRISFEGLDGMMAKAYQTSDIYNLQYIGDVDATYGYDVPAVSVTTLVFNPSEAIGAFGEPETEVAETVQTAESYSGPKVKVSIPLGASYSVNPMVNSVPEGSDQTFVIAAKPGYEIKEVTVNEKKVDLDDTGTITLKEIKEPVTFHITTEKTDTVLLDILLDFEKMEPGVEGHSYDGIDYVFSEAQENYTSEASEKKIQSGKSLMFNYVDKRTSTDTLFTMIDGQQGFTNWGGVKELWFYVDTSEFRGQAGVHAAFAAQYYEGGKPQTEYNLFSLRSNNTTHTNEFTYYIQDGNGGWKSVDDTRWGRALLPEKYVGWVRFPISIFASDSGRTPTGLFNVFDFRIGFNVETGSVKKNGPLYLDTVALYSDHSITNPRAVGQPISSLTIKESGAEK